MLGKLSGRLARWLFRCCDPRRPRRAGAGSVGRQPWVRIHSRLRSSPTPEGRCWGHRVTPGMSRSGLRSSPTPEGRCWDLAHDAVPAVQGVAILADPGGPVLAGVLLIATSSVARVAILADPGGPVLGSR